MNLEGDHAALLKGAIVKKLVILNDLHLGAKRVGGTTPVSADRLKGYLLSALSDFLKTIKGADLLIAGDLFDDFDVEPRQLLETYTVLSTWLSSCDSALYLVGGNHDFSPRGDKVSGFHLLANFLIGRFEGRVTLIDKGLNHVRDNVWAISHVANQDLFDMELDRAMTLDGGYLITHCNFMPPPCHGRRDHSLCVDEDRARALTERWIVLNAHEHQHLTHTFSKPVICMGNQWPSSVADCLVKGVAQLDGRKYAHEISDTGVRRIETWCADASFVRVDWRELDSVPASVEFIRVEGSASAEEAALVTAAIAKFRQVVDAYVVANAVSVEGVQGVEDAADAVFENVKAFDVMDALLEHLTPEQQAVIEEVLR